MLRLQLRLFGGFWAQWSNGEAVNIGGTKQRALLAMLVTAKNGIHSRDWLQQMLWSYGDREQGRMNLRRALFDLRKSMGDDADGLIDASYSDIWVDLSRIEILGDRRDGEFLEGIVIPERGFSKWLDQQRAHGLSETIRKPELVSEDSTHTITPTIAVLPLHMVTRQKEDAFLGDLISMELLRSLSRSSLLKVISHLASREHSSETVSMSVIRDQLKADYVAFGVLRTVKNQFIADIELADCATGNTLWSQSITSSVDGLLDRSSDVISDLALQIGFALTSAAVEISQSKPLPSIESHRLLMSAVSNMHSDRLQNFAQARKYLEHLIDDRKIIDSRLHAWLAQWYMLSIPQGWAENPEREVSRANDCVARGLDINANCSFSLAMSGMVNNSPGHDFDEASSMLTRAQKIEPNNPLAHLLQARLFAFKGQGEIAVQHADNALALSPGGPQAYFFENIAATAYVADGRYQEAVKLIDSSLAKNAHHRSSLRVKAVAHELSGDMEMAHATVQRLRALDPDLSVGSYLASHPAGDLNTGMKWAQSLARAGLPT